MKKNNLLPLVGALLLQALPWPRNHSRKSW